MSESTNMHVPSRPDWNCKAPGCGEPWPCSTEKAALLETFKHARLTLRMYLASQMQEAINDAVRFPMGVDIEFWPRFLGWVPPSMRPSASSPEKPSEHGPAGRRTDAARERPSRSSAA